MKWPISAKGKSGSNLKGAPHFRQLAVLSAWQEGQRNLKIFAVALGIYLPALPGLQSHHFVE
jgi:hypothetical protein